MAVEDMLICIYGKQSGLYEIFKNAPFKAEKYPDIQLSRWMIKNLCL